MDEVVGGVYYCSLFNWSLFGWNLKLEGSLLLWDFFIYFTKWTLLKLTWWWLWLGLRWVFAP